MKKIIALSILACLLMASSAWAGQANIFVYHRFGDSRYPSTNVSLEVFEAQLQALKDKDVEVLLLSEIAERLAAGKPLPQNCAAITVDDGYLSFLEGAMPLLRRYGYRATLFVSSASVGRSSYLSWEQLRELQQEGVEIGNHSATHPYLLERKGAEGEGPWRERIREDLVTAQQAFERELGQAPKLFAYPYGEFSPAVTEIAKTIGFAAAVAQQSGVVHEQSDLFTLPRFPMGGPFATLKGFVNKLSMAALPVEVIAPQTPVVGEENPPVLIVDIDPEAVDLRRMQCFVDGQEGATITPVEGFAGRFEVRAAAPLLGRRSKYTLTAPARSGRQWYWFSQPWFQPRR